MRTLLVLTKEKKSSNLKLVSFTHTADDLFDSSINYEYRELGKMKYDSSDYHQLKKELLGYEGKIVLITDENSMYLSNRLMWEVESIVGSAYADMDNPYQVESHVTKKDTMLWDMQANLSKENDQAFMSGWNNSYNNAAFTNEEIKEYINDSVIKLTPFLDRAHSRVLEVGVGSGMIAQELSPLCKEYTGSDISRIVLDKLKVMNEERGIENMSLYHCGADEIDCIGKKYDVILMSSVTEYFSGVNYMRKVVEICVHNIDEKGYILIADVFGLETKEAYRTSVNAYAKKNPGCRYKKDFSHELYISKKLWEDFEKTIDGIKRVQILDKEGVIDNEINNYRYDVMIEVDHSIVKSTNQKINIKSKLSKLTKFQITMNEFLNE